MNEKKLKILLSVLAAALLVGLIFILVKLTQNNFNLNSWRMKLTSPIFTDNQHLPVKFTCDGTGLNPPLNFAEVPKKTKTLALIMDDPDAPSGTFVHWVVWNIPAGTAGLEETGLPDNTLVGKNTTGQNNYVAPCPPAGTHRYIFKLYALDAVLNLPPATDKAGLEQAMKKHLLAQTELVGLYSRGN